MTRMRARFVVPAFGLALIWAADANAATNLITNGSFDAPDVGTGWGMGNNSDVPGWTNTANWDWIEIDYWSVVMPTPFNSTTLQSAELDGAMFDTLSQTVVGLTVGQTYTLSWAYGDRPGSGPQQTDILFGGTQVGTNIGDGSGLWTYTSVEVTATAASEVLSFAAQNTFYLGGRTSVGNEITAVSLTADVPEPASIAVLGLGLTGLAASRRKRA